MADSRPSNEQVRKAGDVLKRQRTGGDVDPFELRAAFDTVVQFRALWAAPPQPLAMVNMGLRSRCQTLQLREARVSQRLKRLDRIVEKLARPEHRTMRLPQMEDIGGCRIVVGSLGDVRAIHERIADLADGVVDEHDYAATPKADGYRAHHTIVRCHGFLVEIQLRTRRQHLWAAQVERLEALRGEMLRAGQGDAGIRGALRGVSDVLALADQGKAVPADVEARLAAWLELLTKLE